MAETPLAGRHALITGGGTGIGAAAAERLSAAGAKLSLLGRRLEPLQAVAEAHGGIAIGCDVTDSGQIGKAFDEARTLNGPIDLLIVNAGIAESAPFHKMTRESWDRIIGTNLTAAFSCSQAAIGDLLKSDNGPPCIHRVRRQPPRRPLRIALCRVEARPARPDAQPRRRICQD